MILQYVADDADAPHVRREIDRVKPHDFRRHELRSSKHHPRLDARVVLTRQAEVDDLDPVTGATETEDVLRLTDSKFSVKNRLCENVFSVCLRYYCCVVSSLVCSNCVINYFFGPGKGP